MEKQIAELGYNQFINTITTTALVRLLMSKGLISQEELALEFEKAQEESKKHSAQLLSKLTDIN